MSSTFTEQQAAALWALTSGTSLLSLFAGAAVLVSMARQWKRRFVHAPSRIAAWWTVADMFAIPATLVARAWYPWGSSFGEPVPAGPPSAGCFAQAWAIQFGFLASAIWATITAINVYLSVCLNKRHSKLTRYEPIYHVVAWGIPFALASVPPILYGSSFYGDGQVFCWISPQFTEFRMYFFFIPVWSLFGLIALIYIRVGYALESKFNGVHLPLPSPRDITAGGGESGMKAGSAHGSTGSSAPDAVKARFLLKSGTYVGAYCTTFLFATVAAVRPGFAWAILQAAGMPLGPAVRGFMYFWNQWHSSHGSARSDVRGSLGTTRGSAGMIGAAPRRARLGSTSSSSTSRSSVYGGNGKHLSIKATPHDLMRAQAIVPSPPPSPPAAVVVQQQPRSPRPQMPQMPALPHLQQAQQTGLPPPSPTRAMPRSRSGSGASATSAAAAAATAAHAARRAHTMPRESSRTPSVGKSATMLR